MLSQCKTYAFTAIFMLFLNLENNPDADYQ
jgi:hypothetical protein